jgi:hypothetical protein
MSLGYDKILNKVLGEHTIFIFTATLKMKVACFSKTQPPHTTRCIKEKPKMCIFTSMNTLNLRYASYVRFRIFIISETPVTQLSALTQSPDTG